MKKGKRVIDDRGSDGYEELADAIVTAASDDYKHYFQIVRKHPYDKEANDELKEIEQFFYSPLYGVITTIDPDYLINRLRKEVEEDERKRILGKRI